jgi:hypothetical protein
MLFIELFLVITIRLNMKKSEKPLANVIAFVALLLFASCGFATESSNRLLKYWSAKPVSPPA